VHGNWISCDAHVGVNQNSHLLSSSSTLEVMFAVDMMYVTLHTRYRSSQRAIPRRFASRQSRSFLLYHRRIIIRQRYYTSLYSLDLASFKFFQRSRPCACESPFAFGTLLAAWSLRLTFNCGSIILPPLWKKNVGKAAADDWITSKLINVQVIAPKYPNSPLPRRSIRSRPDDTEKSLLEREEPQRSSRHICMWLI